MGFMKKCSCPSSIQRPPANETLWVESPHHDSMDRSAKLVLSIRLSLTVWKYSR